MALDTAVKAALSGSAQLAPFADLKAQLDVLGSRLRAAAKEHPFKSRWLIEVGESGVFKAASGVVIHADVFTHTALSAGVGDLLYLYHIALKGAEGR